ncbi:MAG: threonylcarbamoyl-AMP synthase [Anaerolineae bacterium]|nr:threonylcarbamoyl-AMP synthase [Anaerolineae bacterium]
MSPTKIISTSSPRSLQQALLTLQKGGVIVFPTDTVYGLGVPIRNEVGINRLFEIKGRDFNKAIAVLVGDIKHLPQLTPGLTPVAEKLAKAFWPGALTLVVPCAAGLPHNLSPLPTVGIRMPNHPFALKLLCKSGPLATTSANVSGGANTITARQVLEQLDGSIDLLLDGGQTPGAVPSTVVDCTKAELTILRQGAITQEQMLAVL